MSSQVPPDDESRWDWLWTTLKVLAWFVIGLVALMLVLFGICVAAFRFMEF